jgi:GTP1/Obg family GTP-binding protein
MALYIFEDVLQPVFLNVRRLRKSADRSCSRITRQAYAKFGKIITKISRALSIAAYGLVAEKITAATQNNLGRCGNFI